MENRPYVAFFGYKSERFHRKSIEPIYLGCTYENFPFRWRSWTNKKIVLKRGLKVVIILEVLGIDSIIGMSSP